MLRNYIKTAFRSLLKNPLSSFINVFGLSVAIGCAIVTYTYVMYDLRVDQFHKKRETVFMATIQADREGQIATYGFSPNPLGKTLHQDVPEIVRMARVEDRQVVVKRDANIFHERVRFIDPDFLHMFSFPLQSGGPSDLMDPSQIIISHKIAIKYFGSEDPLGKSLSVTFGDQGKRNFTVAGVAEEFPNLSSIRFSILANISQLPHIDPSYDPADWTENISATFIEVDNIQDIGAVQAKAKEYIALHNSINTDAPISQFQFEPLSILRTREGEIRGSIADQSDPQGRIVTAIIGLLLILLACFNYINIAIVSATKRLKEIGIRKVMGGARRSIIYQFLVENIVMTFFATVFGFLLGITFFIPQFDRLFSVGVEFDLLDPMLWVYVLGIMVFTGLASGAYPALYISKFNPTNIFKGSLKFGRKNYLTKVFLGIQLILSCITIVCGISFVKNAQYISKRDWGYEQKQVLSSRLPDANSFEKLKQELSQHPDVLHIAGSQTQLGNTVGEILIDLPDRKVEVQHMEIDTAYITTMGLRLKEGRNFSSSRQGDAFNVLINETFAKKLDWEKPIGQTFRYEDQQFAVIGVVADYHHFSFYDKIQPAFFSLVQEGPYTFISIQARQGKTLEVFDHFKETWASVVVDVPFEGLFQEQIFDWYFANTQGHGRIMSFVAFLAVLLSCLGLYGLVSLNLASRLKEMSIRKILGAHIGHMVKLVNGQFSWILLISLLVGGPLSYMIIVNFFQAVYVYYMPMSYFPVIFALVIILCCVLLTTSSQVWKLLNADPKEGLRVE